MCGICGVFYRDPTRKVSGEMLDAMVSHLHHRGPDDSGTFRRPGGALGHARLTIIDLVGGQQPMASSDDQAILTFNGEIYNYLELRNQYLPALSERAGDTEVLLHLLQARGARSLEWLNGMFAFAFWDRTQHTVILARDPVGQKPLFYHFGSRSFTFASDLSSLVCHPDVPLEIDREALAHYLFFEAFLHPQTPLRGVHKLFPGHCLILDLKAWTIRRDVYWDNPICAMSSRPSDMQALRDFETTFQEAVDRHLRADVDVGIFLSGGLDSPSLVKAACRIRPPETIQTFTIRHELDSFNEADQAREIADHYGTRHREQLLTKDDFLSDVPRVLSGVDEPIADPGFLAIYEVVKFSRQHVKVILSGNGGDEFWAGYAPFQALNTYRWANRFIPGMLVPWLMRLVQLPRANHDYMNAAFKIQRFLRGLKVAPQEVLMQWISAFNHREIDAILAAEAPRTMLADHPQWGVPNLYTALYDRDRALQQRDLVSVLLHSFQQFYLPGCICNHADKSSMMVSQELRSPFLDTAMMQLANRLPPSLKFHNGQTKYLVRQYLREKAPASVSKRPKRGFTVPIASWLTSSLRQWANDILDPRQIKSDGFFNPSAVRRLWDDHQNRRANHAKPLWTLLVFQHWLHNVHANWRSVRNRI